MSASLGPPAPRPCEGCPYRQDVPAGIWAREEYDKLRRYDAEAPEQPRRILQCHLEDAGSETARVCAGWSGCHGNQELLSLFLALVEGTIDTTTFRAVIGYTSPVPLFDSGNAAADHGEAGIDEPSADAHRVMNKIARVRGISLE